MAEYGVPTKPKLNRTASAWISPDGAYYDVPDASHHAVACEIFPGKSNPGYGMESAGWVHLSYGNPHVSKAKLTQAQINVLYDLAAQVTQGHYDGQNLLVRLSQLMGEINDSR
jgi:hypothetical protein